MNIRDLDAQARTAWHAAGHTGHGIIFALFDTGARPVGPLKGHVLAGTPDGLTDTAGHGTFVAGQLIEWCPDAQILSFRVLPKGRDDPTTPIIDWLEKLLPIVKADTAHRYVVNMSLSGLGNLIDPDIQRYKAAIDALVAAGVPVFVAAGNDGQNTINLYPSGFESPITVAAVDETGRWAGFSTHHKNVDFTALGKDVCGLDMNLGIMCSFESGTSMSCPNLAGPGGLLIEAFGLSEPQLYEALKTLATDLGDGGCDPYYGWGYVDMKTPAAVKALLGVTKEEPEVLKKIYLSASTQEGNPTYPLPGIDCKTEEQHCQALMDIVATRLKAHGLDVRRNNGTMTWDSSYRDGNAWAADVYVCLHTNGSANKVARGAYWAFVTTDGKNRKLADLLAKYTSMDGVSVNVANKTGAGGFGEIDLCRAKHCAYAELGYHSNLDDHKWFHKNMSLIAEGITQGVCEYVGVKYVPVDAPTPSPAILYKYTGTGVNIRSKASLFGSIRGKFKGAETGIEILSIDGGWRQVKFGTVTGWCKSDMFVRA